MSSRVRMSCRAMGSMCVERSYIIARMTRADEPPSSRRGLAVSVRYPCYPPSGNDGKANSALQILMQVNVVINGSFSVTSLIEPDMQKLLAIVSVPDSIIVVQEQTARKRRDAKPSDLTPFRGRWPGCTQLQTGHCVFHVASAPAQVSPKRAST